ncbi:hypothetical protein JT359_00905 [Candidatus Poribacteria bacterium]|nr:hypothetical protein [Candidatus Poribacteria bacterium]
MKIAIIGSRQIAQTVAWGISHTELAQKIVIYSDSQFEGKRINRNYRTTDIRDIILAGATSNSDTDITITDSPDKLSKSDIVLLLPAEQPVGYRSNQGLKKLNLSIIQHVIPTIHEYISNSKILVGMQNANYISAWIHHSIGSNNVIGISNGIATAQLKATIANKLRLSVKDISALAIGNDSITYPLPQYCRVNGIPLSQLLDETRVKDISNSLSDFNDNQLDSIYTLTSHILEIVSAIALDKKRVMSVGTLISTDSTSVFINVPSKIGGDGIEGIIPLELTDTQREQFTQLVAQSATDQSF